LSRDPAEAAAALPAERRRRVFYALWPQTATRQALARAARTPVRQAGGRATATENLHLTLAFLGALAPAALERARALRQPTTPAFELTLDRLGYWPRSRILWLAPSVVPEGLDALVQWLWHELGEMGLTREPQLFRPHVTLSRRAREVGGPVSSVDWVVDRFALVESLPAAGGSRYEPLGDWRLPASGLFVAAAGKKEPL
jgi:2'-5' RNA ligase